MSPLQSTRIVLQGEFAITNGQDGISKIKTSSPFSCTVLTLYSARSSITALTHLDEYADVKETFRKMKLILKNRFGVPLNETFKATISGGIDEKFSMMTQGEIKVKIDPDRSLSSVKRTILKLKELDKALPVKMQEAIKAKDFNLLLRQSSSDVNYLPILQFLIENRDILEINLQAAGKMSGTALDVAQKFIPKQPQNLVSGKEKSPAIK